MPRSVTPTCTVKTLCDRIGSSHDINFRKVAIEEGLAAGCLILRQPAQLVEKVCLGADFFAFKRYNEAG